MSLRDRLRAEGRCVVCLKIAMSLDGQTATRGGESQWITGPEARRDGRRHRGQLDGIAVGVNTVIADDPELSARDGGGSDPVRIVFDSQLRTPIEARLIQGATAQPSWLITTPEAKDRRGAAYEAHGARVLAFLPDAAGRPPIPAVLEKLYAEGLQSLLVEGGASLHGAFVDAGQVDQVLCYVAPIILGGEGRPAVAGLGAARLKDALQLDFQGVAQLGQDLRIEALWKPRSEPEAEPEA